MRISKSTIHIATVASFGSLLPIVALAQAAIFTPLDELGSSASITDYIVNLYNFGLAAGGILAVGMIVAGAIYYSISGAVDKKTEGKDMILSAIFGLVLLFGSYLILNTVNPELVTLGNPTGTSTPGATLTLPLAACTINTPANQFSGTKRACGPADPVPSLPTGDPPLCLCYTTTSTPPGNCPDSVVNACKPLRHKLLDSPQTIFVPQCGGGCDDHITTAAVETVIEYWSYPYYPELAGPTLAETKCAVFNYRLYQQAPIKNPNMDGLVLCPNGD